MDRLVDDRGWQAQTAVAGVFSRWPDLVGADLASHVRPDGFDESSGELTLRTDSTAWATQTGYLIPQLQARLDEEIGTGIVRGISVRGPNRSPRRRGRWRVPGPGPRDTYG